MQFLAPTAEPSSKDTRAGTVPGLTPHQNPYTVSRSLPEARGRPMHSPDSSLVGRGSFYPVSGHREGFSPVEAQGSRAPHVENSRSSPRAEHRKGGKLHAPGGRTRAVEVVCHLIVQPQCGPWREGAALLLLSVSASVVGSPVHSSALL
jgi:hypothetical protein